MREAGDLDQPRVHAQRHRALLVRADAAQRQAEARAPQHDRRGHGQHRDQQHRQVDGVALGHHGEHAADGAGDLLFPVGDGMADQLGHAEGQHREVGAAQVQHQRAHHHRHAGGDAGAEHDGHGPARLLQHERAGVGADAEEGRGGQRQVARGAAEQAPAGGQRDVHQAGQRQRDDELAGEGGDRDGPAGEAEEHQQVAGEKLARIHGDTRSPPRGPALSPPRA